MADNEFLLGCDVGTGSVRVGLFDIAGNLMEMEVQDIKMWRPQPDFVEQSSQNIWQRFCTCVNGVLEHAEVEPSQIKGVGFDATCSLVVLDDEDEPLSVSPSENDEQNIMVWMDHRAMQEAEEINSTGHGVLKYVGGKISPEMEMPKLLWLKKHKPETWEKAAKFFDLADYLVYRATNTDVRSLCTTTCKWTYLGHEGTASETRVGKWDDSFFKEVGLEEFTKDGYRRIGDSVRPVGEPVGEGISEQTASETGLKQGTPVGVSIIDAHAGGLGLLGMKLDDEPINLENRLALIGGTSSCHMAVSQEPRFIDGVWGPYYSAMVPDMWLTEGGQSATGALVDHIIYSSKISDKVKAKAEEEGKTVYEILNQRLYELAEQQSLSDISLLTKDLHVLPYFHGNRSPRANPSLLGSIFGLNLSSTIDDLALLYLATIQSIAYGTRHIIETLNGQGYSIDKIMATGGGTKNDVFLKEHADICNCTLVLPKEQEAVLLGSSVLGAVASGCYASIVEAMENMNEPGSVIEAEREITGNYHEAKYQVFKKMYQDETSYFDIMEEWKQEKT